MFDKRIKRKEELSTFACKANLLFHLAKFTAYSLRYASETSGSKPAINARIASRVEIKKEGKTVLGG